MGRIRVGFSGWRTRKEAGPEVQVVPGPQPPQPHCLRTPATPAGVRGAGGGGMTNQTPDDTSAEPVSPSSGLSRAGGRTVRFGAIFTSPFSTENGNFYHRYQNA